MANYSLTEDQSAAILEAISIVQDMASGEPVSRPVLSETFIRNISNVQGIIEKSNSAKAEKYLKKISESLNMMGLGQEADAILGIRSAVTEVKKEVDKKHEDFDMDLKSLPMEFERFELEQITEAGFKTGLEFIDTSTKEIHHAINKGGLEIMTTIRIEELKTLIAKALKKMEGEQNFDMDLKLLPIEFKGSELEKIEEIGIKTGLQFLDRSTDKIFQDIRRIAINDEEIISVERINKIKSLIPPALSEMKKKEAGGDERYMSS